MRFAKHGEWYKLNVQRSLANNSVNYKEKPDVGTFMREWLSLYDSKSGERGIYNSVSAKSQVQKLNEREPDGNGNFIRRRDARDDFGTNPCSEIILRERTNGKSGKKKTGELLDELRKIAIKTNAEWADKLGIPRSAAITCVKPSGTVSQLVDSASGIHARHNPYYIRTVRADNKDPLCKFMKDQNFPNEPDVTKPDHTTVFAFPQKSPKGAVCRTDLTALEQLDLWKLYQDHWCEHKPSVTVSVKEPEWLGVGSWVWDNFENISGISFLPFSEHNYKQAPYQDCNKKQHDELVTKMPKNVNWSKLGDYEKEDHTAGAQSPACGAPGGCEVVDLI
jgi:ribonucleoside-diphosphate reductase alpha chain